MEQPQRNHKALERFLEAHQEYEWEPVCPPDCRINHDKKWWGVTVPMPKKVKQQPPRVKLAKSSAFYLEGAPEPTRKTLQLHQNVFGDCKELHELAKLFGIDLKVRKEKVA